MNAETYVQEIRCHRISGGNACGPLLVSLDDICFYLVDPKTGVVIEKGHTLEEQSIAGKILVFPSGKGSSVVQADGLYQLDMNNTAPLAMIIEHPDTVLVASAIIMGIPLVDRVDSKFYEMVGEIEKVQVDADLQVIRIIP